MTIIHEPSRPVRTDVIGEVVFMSAWQELNRETVLNDNSQIVSFLRNILEPITYSARKDVTQREALVAASFIKWLGTGCGSCFLSEMLKTRNEAPLLGEQKTCAEYWAKENVIDTRTGYRLIQNIIAKADDYVAGALPGLSHVGKYVSYTTHDVDVIECICRFLGTKKGMSFATSCTDIIQAHWAKESKKVMETFSLPKVAA